MLPDRDDEPPDPVRLRDGFAGQRMSVLPRPVVREALRRPVTRRLLVTDAGFFPRARDHGRSRPAGAPEHVVVVCADGAGWCRTAAGRFAVHRGDALLLPARQAHEYAASPEDPWTLWWMHCTGSDAGELVEAATAGAGGPVAHLRDPGACSSLLAQVIDALNTGTAGGLVQASGAAWNVLASIAATGRRPRGEALSPVERALAHLRATSPHRTPVAELAAVVGLSPSQLSALFREQVGTSPLRHQNDLRMARARELLDGSDASVREVAHACGYPDELYFSRQFRRTHGVPPTGYRNRPA